MASDQGRKITIAGAGIAGLSLSKSLSERGIPNEILETRDRIGGVSVSDGNSQSILQKLQSKIEVQHNTTLVNVGDELWAVSPRSKSRAPNAVSATGFRALTIAELGIFGDRPAGVFGMQSTIDATLSGYEIGREIVLYGFNHYSLFLAKFLQNNTRARVTIADDSFDSLIHSREEAVKLGIPLVDSRISAIKGHQRIEKLMISNEKELSADALVACKFVPHTYLKGAIASVGNSLRVIEDQQGLMELSDVVAENLAWNGARARIESELPCYPRDPSIEGIFLVFLPRMGARLLLNKREVEKSTKTYQRINVSGEKLLEVGVAD